VTDANDANDANDGNDGRDAIERYLDRLADELGGRVRGLRRILHESEDHLGASADAGVEEGLTRDEAARRAVARFGDPRAVAHNWRRSGRWLVPVPVLVQALLSLALVAAIGLIGIGASGAVADGMGAVFGKRFVAADTNGVTYTPARCADFLEYHPEAHSCEAAATAHHFDEVVLYRSAAGFLGVAVLVGWWFVRRRRWASSYAAHALPDGFAAIVGAALFGVAAAGLVFVSVGQIVIGGDSSGAGQYLSGGVVAAVIAAGFGVAVQRTLANRSQAVD